MPFYTYKARDDKGELVKERLEAEDEHSLRKMVEERGLFLISFSKEKKLFNLNAPIFGRFSVSTKDLFSFTMQLAHTLSAGISILSALSIIIDECKNVNFKHSLEKIYDSIKGGSSFSGALSQYPQIFSSFFVSMVEMGEGSGNLSEILYRLGDYFKRQREIRRKLITSMIYPAILTIVTITIITLLLTFIFPKFVELFHKEGVALPTPTQVLLTISNFARGYWYILILAVAALIVLFKIIYSFPAPRLLIDREIINLPIFGNLVKKMFIYRFTDSLGILYASGLTMVKAMDNIEKISNNRYFANFINDLRTYMIKGGDISRYLKDVRMFPGDIIGMIRAGEESGTLGDILNKVAQIQYYEINEDIERVIAFIEPALIIFAGLSVGFIALSLLLPVFRASRIIR